MDLSDIDKQTILPYSGRTTFAKEIHLQTYADDEDVFNFWGGRKEKVTNSILPFHSSLTFNIFVWNKGY